MTERVFQNHTSFEVSGKGNAVEVYVFDPKTSDRAQGEVMIAAGGETRHRANFTMTAEEATLLKQFLIRQGY